MNANNNLNTNIQEEREETLVEGLEELEKDLKAKNQKLEMINGSALHNFRVNLQNDNRVIGEEEKVIEQTLLESTLEEEKIVKKKNGLGIAIMLGLVIVMGIGTWGYGMLKLNWKVGNNCGFIHICGTEKAKCRAVWQCGDEEEIEMVKELNEEKENTIMVVEEEKVIEKKKEIMREEIKIGEINWLDNPIKIENEIFEIGQEATVSAYKVGNLKAERELLYFKFDIQEIGEQRLRVIRDKEEIFVVANAGLVSEKWLGWVSQAIKVKFSFVEIVDKENILSFERLNYRGIDLEIMSDFYIKEEINQNNWEELGEIAQGKLYRNYESVIMGRDDLANRKIYLEYQDGFFYEYQSQDLTVNEDGVAEIIWADGGKNDMKFKTYYVNNKKREEMVVRDGSEILHTKVEVGELSGRGKIYQFKGVDNEVVQMFYEKYKDGVEEVVSIEIFENRINHFVRQDALGDWKIYWNEEFL